MPDCTSVLVDLTRQTAKEFVSQTMASGFICLVILPDVRNALASDRPHTYTRVLGTRTHVAEI